jgi:hypothetical protein
VPPPPIDRTCQINPILVDRESFLHVGQHVIHVPLGDSHVTHGAAGERRGHDEIDITKRREVPGGLRVGLARAVAFAEYTAEVHTMIRPRPVKTDDQRILLRSVVALRHVQPVRLI